jgi:FkbM family methyltransferase
MTSSPDDSTGSGVFFAQLIRFLRRIPVLASVLRWIARQYPEGSVVTIPFGHARGLMWQRHHRHISAYWLGQYELPIQAVLARELRLGSLFFDIGANAGFFTLLAASRVGPTGRCVAFDPDHDNIASIRQQCSLNGFSSVLAINEAVSDVVGTAWFTRAHPGAATGHLVDRGVGDESVEVATTTLDAAATKYGTPDVIKMDIEGAEGKALRGAAMLIRERRSTWLIEIHSPASAMDVRAAFAGAGYEVVSLRRGRLTDRAVLPTHVLVRPERTGRGPGEDME